MLGISKDVAEDDLFKVNIPIAIALKLKLVVDDNSTFRVTDKYVKWNCFPVSFAPCFFSHSR